MTTAEVIIIGGGVNGASAAFHLAQAGVRNIVLLEQGHIAFGATGKSGALVRMHYTNPHESLLAHESLKIFQHWPDMVGSTCGFQRSGFVQIVAPEYEAELRANVADQQALGINTEVIAASELADMEPWCHTDDLSYVAYEADSGFADPNATTFSLLQQAQQRGVDVRTHTRVTAIRTAGDRVVGVDTENGAIAAPTVLLAGGAWANRLLAPLGLDYGLQPHRVQVVVFRWPTGFNHAHVAYIDTVNHTWFRPEGTTGTLIGTEIERGPTDPDSYDETPDHDYVALARERLSARFPFVREATMRGGWAGMIMMSLDRHPIIDQVPAVPGLFVMLGDSGSSFKTAPAVGKCLAEWITTGAPHTADLSPFRSTRFAEDELWTDSTTYGRTNRTISR